VNRFARLLDDLVLSPSRGGKLRLLAAHFREVPDPDRGWALAALTGALDFRHATPAVVRRLAASRIDPVLFALSHDYVGDLAETVALTWPAAAEPDPPSVDEIVRALAAAARADVPGLLAGWLDRLDAAGRWALLKLVTGALRVGVSGRLARTALAELGAVELARIEEAWHALEPPYEGLFAWLEGRGPAPAAAGPLAFRPVMLAHPLEDADRDGLDPALLAAEWKWDGARIQLCGDGAATRLHSRTGDDIGPAFPEIREGFGLRAVLDGELLAGRPGAPGTFNALQQRLNRKAPTRRLLEANPVFVRLYDILLDGDEDLRALPFAARRARLEAWHARHVAGTARAGILDLSATLSFSGWDELATLRASAAAQGAEGLMLKRLDSPYLGGRPRGPWFKWKRDPMRVDAVLLYAQRGHGRRSSFYSDFTFGCWGAGGELVPVGKAYFGFTDEELARLDRWVRAHAVDRFGPVLVVERALVCELAFDAVQVSSRHKSGVALRFPRIERIRWDKPAAEADRVEALAALAGTGQG
jgi:DNA ligase-1